MARKLRQPAGKGKRHSRRQRARVGQSPPLRLSQALAITTSRVEDTAESANARVGIAMDMSVSVAPQKQAALERRQAPSQTRPNSSDLDEWLAKVEAMGELKRITAEVDPDLEAATITYLVGQRKKPGAVVREHQGPSRTSRALQHDRLQPVAVLPDDRRRAGRSSAQGGAGAAAQDGPHHEAQGGAGGDRDLQSEHRRPATRSTSANFRRSACGRSTAGFISAPATRW